MSLKFDKDFFRGLFTLEENNKCLFIIPVCYFLIVTILFMGISFLPVIQGDEAVFASLVFLIGGLAGYFTVVRIRLYLYKHGLNQSSFKKSEDADQKSKSLFVLSLFCGLIMFFAVPFLIGQLAKPTTLDSFLSLKTLLHVVGSVIFFAVLQSFFKYAILSELDPIKTNTDPLDEI